MIKLLRLSTARESAFDGKRRLTGVGGLQSFSEKWSSSAASTAAADADRSHR